MKSIKKLSDVQIKIDELEAQIDKNKNINANLESEISKKEGIIRRLQIQEDMYKLNFNIEESYVNNFDEKVTSNELKDKLALLTLNEKELVKENKDIEYHYSDMTKSYLNSQIKQIRRSFNVECDFYFSNVTAKNYETYHKKIIKSYEILNKIYKVDNVAIDKKFLKLKLEKLQLIHNYALRLEQERELQREIKEQIKEEERVKRELEQKRKEIEKEEKQFNNEVRSLFKRLEKSQSEIEKELYADKIKELETKLKELEVDKKDVENRQTNTRAGFVYIISNIGSFGEGIYKIGLTRRLEPYDRIKELGDASVPFSFDVHAMIFSEDAPKLENTLHKHFRDREINKVNHRKEFFKVDIDEIESVVKTNHNKTVEFIKVPVAEEYWESQRISDLNIKF
ncbi:DUF4041 domain-containing protein [Staphylococcus delphini]|uniref:DUF4041 domain-containing protein n=1 Tax=Staphylococcus delphini TaxID=53344 RepID=UPI0019D40D4C|nr:DUF4041 domain-containing protein [Staphylococcus delphini]